MEMRKYFPGLYDGRVSSAQIHQRELSPDSKARTPDEKMQETAQEFQSLFIKMMLSSMRATLKPENDMLGGGRGQEIFKDMLFDQYALQLSRDPLFTLDEQMIEQLTGSKAQQNAAARGYARNE
ncbi:MAG: rod-binding protein [Spirochaetales bacterium]|nr:rod-binding protein [Spirochaetales bacterium]